MVKKMDDLIKIIKLGRIQFLVAGFILYSLGGLLAALVIDDFSYFRFIFGYMVLMPAHLSVSYSNDYFDLDADLFSEVTQFTGGSGILQDNPHLINFSYNFALFLIFSSIFLSLLFAWYYSTLVFFLWAVFGNLLGWYYTAPPLQLSYRGLGEIGTILTGLIIPGFGYLALTGHIDQTIILFSIPLMIFQLLFILSVQIPDKEADTLGGKKNLIVKYGRKLGFKLMGLSSLAGSLILISLIISGFFPAVIDFRIIAGICMLLVVPNIYGFIKKPEDPQQATQLSFIILNALVLMGVLTAIYFAYLIII